MNSLFAAGGGIVGIGTSSTGYADMLWREGLGPDANLLQAGHVGDAQVIAKEIIAF